MQDLASEFAIAKPGELLPEWLAARMKKGDLVRVVSVPPGLRDDLDLQTKSLFDLCVGRVFSAIDVRNGLVELHVGEVVASPSYIHSIYIESEYLEVIS